MIRILVAALFMVFSQSAFAQSGGDSNELEQLKKELLEEITRLKREFKPATLYSAEDARFRCGDVPIAHWAVEEGGNRDWGILRGTSDAGFDKGVYRVCNWTSVGEVNLAIQIDGQLTNRKLRARSCMDIQGASNITATSEDKSLMIGFYCRIK